LESAKKLSITLRGVTTRSLPIVASIIVDASGIGPNAQAKIASAAKPLRTPGRGTCAGLRRGRAAVPLVPEGRPTRCLRPPSRLIQRGRKNVRWKAMLISALLAAKIDRNEYLPVVALNQQSHGLPGLRHQRAQLLDRLDRRAVDRQEIGPGLNAGARGRAARFLDHQTFSA